MILKTKSYTINTDKILFFNHNIYRSHATINIKFEGGTNIYLNSSSNGSDNYSMAEIVSIINELNKSFK